VALLRFTLFLNSKLFYFFPTLSYSLCLSNNLGVPCRNMCRLSYIKVQCQCKTFRKSAHNRQNPSGDAPLPGHNIRLVLRRPFIFSWPVQSCASARAFVFLASLPSYPSKAVFPSPPSSPALHNHLSHPPTIRLYWELFLWGEMDIRTRFRSSSAVSFLSVR